MENTGDDLATKIKDWADEYWKEDDKTKCEMVEDVIKKAKDSAKAGVSEADVLGNVLDAFRSMKPADFGKILGTSLLQSNYEIRSSNKVVGPEGEAGGAAKIAALKAKWAHDYSKADAETKCEMALDMMNLLKQVKSLEKVRVSKVSKFPKMAGK